jgi:hypothetical protein
MCAPIVHADDPNSPAKKAAASPASSAAATPSPQPANASSAKAVAPADDELLEFLGSVDEEADGDWIDYLSKTDIAKAGRAKQKPAAAEVTTK